MAHTPGPWRVEPDLSNIGKGGVTMSNGNALGTADDYEWGYLRIEDARLIAAAPELLDAARRAVDVIGNTRDEFGLKLEAEKAYLALRAAIANAEGRA